MMFKQVLFDDSMLLSSLDIKLIEQKMYQSSVYVSLFSKFSVSHLFFFSGVEFLLMTFYVFLFLNTGQWHQKAFIIYRQRPIFSIYLGLQSLQLNTASIVFLCHSQKPFHCCTFVLMISDQLIVSGTTATRRPAI